MKWIQPELYVLQSGHGKLDGRTDGQTDGRTEWNQYTPPTNSLCVGYNQYLKYVTHTLHWSLVATCTDFCLNPCMTFFSLHQKWPHNWPTNRLCSTCPQYMCWLGSKWSIIILSTDIVERIGLSYLKGNVYQWRQGSSSNVDENIHHYNLDYTCTHQILYTITMTS